MSTLTPVVFRFPGTLVPRAGRVAVVGSFNGWDPKAHLLTKTANGDWTITIYLSPGRTVYRFSVDEAFWLDPRDEGRIPNSWGSEYSIRYVRRRMRRSRPQSASDFTAEATRNDARSSMSARTKDPIRGDPR